MRTEILQELDPDDPKLEMPWASPADPSLRFVDLKRFPARLADLPECRTYPALARLLGEVNRADSPLASAKCDVWVTRELAEDEALDFRMPVKVGSYVDLLLEGTALPRSLQAHLKVAEALRASLRSVGIQAQMEIAVRECLFHALQNWGYSLTVFLHAYGESEVEAEKEWVRALGALGQALAEVGTRLRTGEIDAGN